MCFPIHVPSVEAANNQLVRGPGLKQESPKVSSEGDSTPLVLKRTTEECFRRQIKVLFPFLSEEMRLVLFFLCLLSVLVEKMRSFTMSFS